MLTGNESKANFFLVTLVLITLKYAVIEPDTTLQTLHKIGGVYVHQLHHGVRLLLVRAATWLSVILLASGECGWNWRQAV